jgi:hypothetical protein
MYLLKRSAKIGVEPIALGNPSGLVNNGVKCPVNTGFSGQIKKAEQMLSPQFGV